jgi:MarC family integral membrane protein
MGLEFWDLVVIFIVVAGPSKSLAMFVATAGRLPVGERVAIVAKALVTAAVILLIFAVLGQQIIKFFHVSVPALQIAGGVILFVFALDLVLGHSHEEHFAAHDPRAMAVYPLAMPLIASPQAIVAVVVTMSRLPGVPGQAAGLRGTRHRSRIRRRRALRHGVYHEGRRPQQEVERRRRGRLPPGYRGPLVRTGGRVRSPRAEGPRRDRQAGGPLTAASLPGLNPRPLFDLESEP